MQPFWRRFARHAIFVGISLVIIGYILGRGFLMAHRIYSGGAYNAENERVLWQTPLVMATLGIIMTAVLDLLASAFRKRAPVNVAATETSPPAE
jgi:hypothetical protein